MLWVKLQEMSKDKKWNADAKTHWSLGDFFFLEKKGQVRTWMCGIVSFVSYSTRYSGKIGAIQSEITARRQPGRNVRQQRRANDITGDNLNQENTCIGTALSDSSSGHRPSFLEESNPVCTHESKTLTHQFHKHSHKSEWIIPSLDVFYITSHLMTDLCVTQAMELLLMFMRNTA